MKQSLIKKAGTLFLSAILFGGTAAIAFQGVSTITANGQSTVAANPVTTSDKPDQDSIAKLTTAASDHTASGTLDVSAVVEKVMPSVVAITNKSVQEVQNYFGMFESSQAPQTQESESCGSGIIIGQTDSELLIVTNNHVMEGADTLSVCFIDNKAYAASTKGTDADNDLAVIAVPLESISDDTRSEIKVATLGDSASVTVGQQVVAIGNALGYGQSVTTGIVSALDRKIDSKETAPALLQTDAAINPGNSGGALVNMNGELIGINSAKFASTEIEGMGYAIPTATASPIMQELMNRKTREKVSAEEAAYLGISGETVSSEAAAAYDLPRGIYVASVAEGSPAAAAGICRGMIITAFDNQHIGAVSELKSMLEYYAAGEEVTLTVQLNTNGSYEEQTVSVTLGNAQGH